jgi:hypothetical protein
MERRLRISGVLIIMGLIVEAFSLLWVHALAFILFAFVGGLLIGLGILVYLYSLVSIPLKSHGTDRTASGSGPKSTSTGNPNDRQLWVR